MPDNSVIEMQEDAAMAPHADGILMGSETCEICGGKTPDGSLCLRCEEWVVHYAEALPRTS